MTSRSPDSFPRYIDYLVWLSSQNPREGVIEEPRAYYDVMTTLANQRVVRSADGVFYNGEKYPVVITHLTMGILPTYDSSPPVGFDQKLIEKIGMRLVFDDTYYQQHEFLSAPNWHNVVATGPSEIARGNSHLQFDRPLILPSRDTLLVETSLLDATSDPDNVTRRLSCAFNATGLLSQRPYILQSSLNRSSETKTAFLTSDFQNGGSEPIAITDMTFSVSAESTDAVGLGDIRIADVNVRVVGNGTQSWWFQGPDTGGFAPRMPTLLLGKTYGQCVVHRFNGDGVFLEPGRSFYAEVTSLDSAADSAQVALAAHGTLLVV